MPELYADLAVKKLKNSEIEIEGVVPAPVFARYLEGVLEDLRGDFSLPGFRKGHVPAATFRQYVNLGHALEDAAEHALQDAYPEIVQTEGLRTLGRPEVTITKLAEGNPLGFRIKVGVVPEIKLPNYRKIAASLAKTRKIAEVTEEEVENVVGELRRLRAGAEKKPETAEGAPAPAAVPEPPELTDEFVKTLGDFKDVSDFRKKLRENLELEKSERGKREHREALAARLVEETPLSFPESLITAETEDMHARFLSDIEAAKLSLQDYLARAKKTEEEIRKEEREYVERQLKNRFILEGIAKAENIIPDPETVAAELRLLKDRHPESDPERLREYVELALQNEKVLEFLEDIKD